MLMHTYKLRVSQARADVDISIVEVSHALWNCGFAEELQFEILDDGAVGAVFPDEEQHVKVTGHVAEQESGSVGVNLAVAHDRGLLHFWRCDGLNVNN